MTFHLRALCRVIGTVPLLLVGATLGAQPPAVRLGLGGGRSSPADQGAHSGPGRRHSLLVLGVAPARWRVELRGDLMWVHWGSGSGPVSATVNGLAPVGALTLGLQARLRPYALAGAGYYGVGNPGPVFGLTAGVGARIEAERLGLFTEARLHGGYSRKFLTLGATVRGR